MLTLSIQPIEHSETFSEQLNRLGTISRGGGGTEAFSNWKLGCVWTTQLPLLWQGSYGSGRCPALLSTEMPP